MSRIGNRSDRISGAPINTPRIGEEYQAHLLQLILDSDDPFGDPTTMPRIGDEYQAKLPPLRELRTKTDGEFDADSNLHFLVGLPLLLTSLTTRLDLNTSDPGYRVVPGLDEEHWSGAERDSFRLGLYIFEKDFVGVKRVVETKEMGAILSYYFGKFNSSSQYHRWCECRRMKRFGRRMFSAQRQQELVSWMLPRLDVECREALLDVSRLFGDGKMSLVDYVVALKAIVGIGTLMEAVGLGKGRQDLTRTGLENLRSSRASRVLPDCSSLSPSEIIEFLRGDRWLTKAHSSDLFWNAVWPRLRARGWHTERPCNQRYGGKGSLVFLTTGVKKFCRKKLVKRDQYFDSVTEVLSRVAQDPRLIGLGSEAEPRPLEASSSSEEHLSSQVTACPSANSAGGSCSYSSENPRPRELFDLNLPYSDSEDVDFAVEMTVEQDIISGEAEDRHRTLELEIRVDVNQRRHSTRKRRPTARLIYDATYGHNTVRRSNKRKEASGDADQSRPSQRVRGSVSARWTEGAETGASSELLSAEANEGADSKQ